MIPSIYRMKGGAVQLGAYQPGQQGPFGRYDDRLGSLAFDPDGGCSRMGSAWGGGGMFVIASRIGIDRFPRPSGGAPEARPSLLDHAVVDQGDVLLAEEIVGGG